MEESRCSAPGCGALIGGRNHNSATGTVRLGVGEQTAVPGYISVPENHDEPQISRLIMRFLLHCSMYLAASVRPKRRAIHGILGLPGYQAVDTVSSVLRERLEAEFTLLKKKTEFTDDDLTMALHQVLKGASIPASMNQDLRSYSNRFFLLIDHFTSLGLLSNHDFKLPQTKYLRLHGMNSQLDCVMVR
jgi:hypothetical protein